MAACKRITNQLKFVVSIFWFVTIYDIVFGHLDSLY